MTQHTWRAVDISARADVADDAMSTRARAMDDEEDVDDDCDIASQPSTRFDVRKFTEQKVDRYTRSGHKLHTYDERDDDYHDGEESDVVGTDESIEAGSWEGQASSGDGAGRTVKELRQPGMELEVVESLNVFNLSVVERGKLKPGMRRWQFYILLASECALAVGIFLMYTMIGFGHEVYSGLANDDNWKLSWSVAGGSLALFAVLWVLDAVEAARTRGNAFGKTLTFFFAGIGVAGLLVSGMLSVKEYETLPISIYVIFKAGIIRIMKSTVCKTTHNGSFLRHVAYASYFVCVASVVTWFVWVAGWDKQWSEELFDSYALKLGCNTTTTTLANSGDANPGGCDNVAYIMYAAPLAIGALNLVYGLSCAKLSKKGGALMLVTILGTLVAFGTWISVALSAVEMGVATDVIQLVVVFCAIFGIACFITAGPRRVYRQVTKSKLAKKVIGYTQTDLAKALLFCCTMTLLPFALAISVVSAAARRLGLSLYQQPPDMPKDGFLTAATHALLLWWFNDPTKIFKYSAYISIFYFTFSIGVGKGAVLFLAWLVDALSSLNVGLVIFVFILIGVAMFLLPPVPGPPVYLTGGILVVGTLEPKIGFWPATMLCVLICWFVKLFSCALQQKMIGENLGKYVSIRHMCGINSLQMRAIRYCLEQKGFSVAKIAILCGGPDWPTSVLCGILKLDLLQIMIGTSPVLVLYLGYTTIAGALQLKIGSCDGSTSTNSDSSSWGLLNSMFLALAFVSMLITSLSAVYFMEQTVMTKREELDKMPLDEEVEELDKVDRKTEEAYAHVTDWSRLSVISKASVVVAAVSGILSCQLGVVLAQRSFESFTVSCPVAVKDVVKPTGWLSIGLMGVCMVFTKVFNTIARANTRRRLAETESAAEQPERTTAA